MFKTAATKLAHNHMIPSLAGNPRLQPLQEVIAAEKLVLQSLQKLSTGFDKSSEALKAWAVGEGEDIEDAFSSCSTLLSHWIASLSSFAFHIARIRECLKALRTREEALDDMHRRRKSLISKAVSADKKLNKMGIDNKNLRPQTDLLLGLREHIRAIDTEIMKEEASLGDWKRIKAREWMGVLFGGLLECSEKGTVVATFGRAIIGHVSTERTRPGLPRARYSGKTQVESLVMEAERKLDNISFVGEVGGEGRRPSVEHHPGSIPGHPPSYSSPLAQPIAPLPRPFSPSTLPNNPAFSANSLPNSRPTSPLELGDFGEHNSHVRSFTYAAGQQMNPFPFDQLSPISPARSMVPLPSPPQETPGFTPGHQPHFSESSTSPPGADSVASYPRSPPMSPFQNVEEIRPMPSGSRSNRI